MIIWTEDLVTGFESIDLEHKNIVETFNILSELLNGDDGETYFGAFDQFIKTYINAHFEHEETLMLRYHYPEYQLHKSIHDCFKATVKEWADRYDDTIISFEEMKMFIKIVEKWLTHHLSGEDVKLAFFLIHSK